jgi:hypothetical protein
MNSFHNNWIHCYYDTPEQVLRTSPDQTFKVDYKCPRNTNVHLYTESIRTCQTIRDDFPNERYSVFLSGGLESEIMVRAFQQANIPIDIYIGRYENDYNLYDVSYAITLCESLQLPYKIIDFNLGKFLDNDIYDYSKLAQISEARLLPQLALTDRVDGVLILGNGEPAPRRLEPNYETNPNSIWILDEDENFWGWPKYFTSQNRLAIPEWCRYTSDMYNSWMNLRWFNYLIDNKIYGKTSTWSSKLFGYREAYPELLFRKKLTGFELIENKFEVANIELDKLLPDQVSLTFTVEGFFNHELYDNRETSTKHYRKT